MRGFIALAALALVGARDAGLEPEEVDAGVASEPAPASDAGGPLERARSLQFPRWRWLNAAGSDAQALVFAGSVHCHESAIPRCITRRTGVPIVSLLPILASDLAIYPESTVGYDVVLVLEDEEPAVE
jgi:hypothetical protein